MPKSLVIVESPAKAKTINKFLGKDFVVKASMGHVRDLPKNKLGVDEKTFEPTYTVLPSKKKTLTELKKSAQSATAIYLAPDPDREGEAICHHLFVELDRAVNGNGASADAAGPDEGDDQPAPKGRKKKTSKKTTAKSANSRAKAKAPVKFFRVQFNEITKRAIVSAIENPGEIDDRKVDAQQARRILDRLVGYKISPLLWDKVRRGLSAGRVQSVALRIIVEREREIRAFQAVEYWSITARLAADQPPEFEAKCLLKDGEKIKISNEDEAKTVLSGIENADWTVASVTAREKRKNPPPPFITSKLQQDAARRHSFPVSKTMRVAQSLYEGKEVGDRGSVGLITYMRTDSTRVADEALGEVRQYIETTYGEKALPEKPRMFRTKKDAQDAHEAIRPTSLDLPPDAVAPFLTRDELKLYTLIWNRFVASQMERAVFDTTSADIQAGDYTFRASGQVMKFAGWLAVYQEQEEPSNVQDAKEGENESALPPLAKGQRLDAKEVVPHQHFTQPPPRFSEASLVKELEENGIGRPSTYAQILSVLQARDYVEKEKSRFFPTPLGELVTELLVESFGDIVQVEYTARMEGELDEIEEGKLAWKDALKEFWGKFSSDLKRAEKEMRDVKREETPTDITCDKCDSPMVKKWGRYGEFLACSSYPDCKNTREIASSEDGGADAAKPGGNGAKPASVEIAGSDLDESCPKCESPMVVKRGRFGQFLACSAYPKCKTTRRLQVDAQGRLESKPDVTLDEKCPKCDHNLVNRHGRFGEFTCCSDYPTCKFIKLKRTGVDCPVEDCSGHIVERRSRRGRTFYGCDQYPECDFVLWKKPLPQACPSCNAPYILENFTKRQGRVLMCNQDDCDYKESVPAEAEETAPAATT